MYTFNRWSDLFFLKTKDFRDSNKYNYELDKIITTREQILQKLIEDYNFYLNIIDRQGRIEYWEGTLKNLDSKLIKTNDVPENLNEKEQELFTLNNNIYNYEIITSKIKEVYKNFVQPYIY
jgi:hypothetical protein